MNNEPANAEATKRRTPSYADAVIGLPDGWRGPAEIASRLETIRLRHGIENLAELHKRLTAPLPGEDPDGPYEISYSAVRYYQMGHDSRGHSREPAASYLARILAVFPTVNAEWLLTGKGPETTVQLFAEGNAQRLQPKGQAVVEEITRLFERALPNHGRESHAIRCLWWAWQWMWSFEDQAASSLQKRHSMVRERFDEADLEHSVALAEEIVEHVESALARVGVEKANLRATFTTDLFIHGLTQSLLSLYGAEPTALRRVYARTVVNQKQEQERDSTQ